MYSRKENLMAIENIIDDDKHQNDLALMGSKIILMEIAYWNDYKSTDLNVWA